MAGRDATLETSNDASAVKADLKRLIALVEGSRVEEARALVQELAANWPDSEAIQHWRRVLEPPGVTFSSGKLAKPLTEEYGWRRAHAHEYPGCWLAVAGDA